MDRGVDDQAGAVVGGVAQHQGHEAGAKAQAQRLQQAGPGRGFQRAPVGQGEQVAQLAGAEPRQFMDVCRDVHPRLACCGCQAGWGQYLRAAGPANRPFGLERFARANSFAMGAQRGPGLGQGQAEVLLGE
ncbi:hypothetical protein D3C78_1333530 [compost metagenome]